MTRVFNHIKNRAWVFLIVLLVLSILAYSLILLPREIPFLKTLSVLARYNATRFLPVTAILLIAALSIKDQRLSTIATALVFFPLFSLALNGLWAGAYSENYVLAGLVPRSDAFGFYGGAISLMENGVQISIAQRRPLYGGFLAFILWISGGNLQIALAIMVFLTAAVCFFSVLAVKNTFNSAAAVLYFFVLFFFIRRFIGVTMSENMGFLLGTTAFTCFLITLKIFIHNPKKSRSIFLFSTFLFSLSQAARPGAVIILPLLILFAGWLWRDKRKFAWKLMVITTIVVIAGFMVNTIVFKITSPDSASQISNLGYGVYGLAVGGKGWEQIFTDHPEINLLETGIRNQRIFEIILQEITTHPENLIKGLIIQFKILFSFQPTNSLFSFVYTNNNMFNYGLISLFFILSICGITAAVAQRKKPIGAFILLLTLGFLLSLPLAPAYQTQYMRVYASSIFLLGLLPAFGFSSLLKFLPEKIRGLVIFNKLDLDGSLTPAVAFSIFLLIFVVSGPLAVKFLSPSEIPSPEGCPGNQSEVVLKYYPGSGINILRNSPDIMTWVPMITQLDYKGSIHNICCDDEIIYFENIPAPNVLYPAVNLLDGMLMHMIVDGSLLPTGKNLLHICGRIEDVHGERSDCGFLYPKTIRIVQ
ncbi:MAG: hypothetical protein Q7J07_00340 [Pelolinea sp.]|nr:hypothetical protein [Pelolinea sp.]